MAKSKIPVEAQAYAICTAFQQLNTQKEWVRIDEHDLRTLKMWLPDPDILSYEKLMDFGCIIRDSLLSAEPSLAKAEAIVLQTQYEDSSTYRIKISTIVRIANPPSFEEPYDEMGFPFVDLIVSSSPDVIMRSYTMRIATGKILTDDNRLVSRSVGCNDADTCRFCAAPIALRGFDGTLSQNYSSRLETIFNQMPVHLNLKWKDYPDKEDTVCTPILSALQEEIERCLSTPNKCSFFISGFLPGEHFYSVGLNAKNNAAIFTTMKLNYDPSIPFVNAPTKVESIAPKVGKKGISKTTLCITFDNNWAVEVRLINSTGKVSPSAFAYIFSVTKTPPLWGIDYEL